MTECIHKRTEIGWVDRAFRGETFRAKGTVCKECDAHLWDAELQAKFNSWLEKLHRNRKKRPKFRLQPFFTDKAKKALENIAADYPGTTPSVVAKALAVVYLQGISKNPRTAPAIEDISRAPEFLSLREGPTKRVAVGFNPTGILAIDAWAELADMPPAKVIEEAVLRMLAVYLKMDPKGRTLWTEIRGTLELILQAA